MSPEKHLLLMALLLALPALGVAQEAVEDPGEHWKIDFQSSRSVVSDCETVEVSNPFGNIRLRGVPGDEIEVHQVVQHHVDDSRRAVASIDSQGGQLQVSVAFVAPEALPKPIPDAWRKRRVDLSVFMPLACGVRVSTEHGEISVKALTGDVVATSVSGDVTLVGAGKLQASSDFGDLHVTLQAKRWEGLLRFATQTGSIRVELPVGADVSALLESTGELSSDYSMLVEWAGKDLTKTGTVVIGEGTGQLHMKSDRGALKLLRDTSSLLNARQSEDPAADE